MRSRRNKNVVHRVCQVIKSRSSSSSCSCSSRRGCGSRSRSTDHDVRKHWPLFGETEGGETRRAGRYQKFWPWGLEFLVIWAPATAAAAAAAEGASTPERERRTMPFCRCVVISHW
ncbi:unnamed protein product [Ectocarpus fasciculatus]